MGAFVLIGLCSVAGWIEARVGLVGAVLSTAVYAVAMIHMQRKEAV